MSLTRKTCPQLKLKQMDANTIRQRIYYNPSTGMFLWRFSAKGRKAWSLAGASRKNGYRIIRFGDKDYYAHRLAWIYMTGEWPVDLIDHIDGQKSNNSFNNLRQADKIMNGQNIKKATSSNKLGVLGVWLDKTSGKYCSQIKVNKKRKWVGAYSTIEEASAAYLIAKRELQAGCTI